MYLNIWGTLAKAKPMVFLAGPRQSGKTTLARRIAEDFDDSTYFNWDFIEDRRLLLKDPVFFTKVPRKGVASPLVIWDELHKYRLWKSYLKGMYDKFSDQYRFLVSGSGRLDIYQRGGDSMAGRYELFHLWPFTLAEMAYERPNKAFFEDPLRMGEEDAGTAHRTIWESLQRFSGFPEPFLAAAEDRWVRWSRAYGHQLVREDIRDQAGLKHIDLVEVLYHLLPERVGSLLSLNALAEVLQVSFHTVKAWVETLERFYLVFRISPWARKIARGLSKERKLYLFDTPRIQDVAARFENAVALELFRAVRNWNDLGLGDYALRYVRNREKEEVDFLLTRSNLPWLLIEAKVSESRPAPALMKFQSALNVPAVQVVNTPIDRRYYANGSQRILVTPAWAWLHGLP